MTHPTTPAKILVIDKLDPEVLAMLQAFYSRSDKSIEERLPSLGDSEDSIKANLRKWYLGYGHSSIAGCGDTTLFIENVSLLCAKAIQDDQLYEGQETSTRYFDFEHRPCVSPLGEEFPQLTALQDELVAAYARLRPLVAAEILGQHPFKLSSNSEDSPALQAKKWENAINARAFDIVRGILPAGITTQLSWKGSLRRVSERLHTLIEHPCSEISGIASSANSVLCERYPNSFKQPPTLAPPLFPFYDLDSPGADKEIQIGEVGYTLAKFRELSDNTFSDYLRVRERQHVVPNYFNLCGEFMFEFLLDFGSFRDVQRHRNSLTPLPLLGSYTINGYSNMFHPWYLEQLGPYGDEVTGLLAKVYATIDEVLLEMSSLGKDMYHAHAEMQYYYPLGTVVPVTAVYGLAEAIYVSELRTSSTVHPTLRQIAHGFAEALQKEYPEISLYTDNTPDGFVLRRGGQTIFAQEDL